MRKWIKILLIVFFLLIVLNIVNPLFYYDHFINNNALVSENPHLCSFMILSTTNIHHPFLYFALFDSGGNIDRDTCIADVASKVGNFSICEEFYSRGSFGTGQLGECYIRVRVANSGNYNHKNTTVETCLEILKDSDAKRECINDFAVKNQDLTICNLLSDETLQEICYQNTPTENCQVWNNKSSEKDLCIDSVYQSIIVNAANEGNFSICEEFFSPSNSNNGYLKECYSQVISENIGNYNHKNTTVETCLEILKDSDAKRNCVTNFAVKNQDLEMCNLLSDQIFDNISSEKDSCVLNVRANIISDAAKDGNFSICEEFFSPSNSNNGYLEECYSWVISKILEDHSYKNTTVETCSEILKDRMTKGECIKSFAINRQNITMCNLLSDQTLQEICYQNTPIKNCETFDNISSEKDLCIYSVNFRISS